MAEAILKESLKLIPHMKRLPSRHVWLDYDKEADVMYISFEKPQRSSDTEVLKDGALLRKRGRKIVGITILNASRL